jgi:hypothetical protein
MAIIRKQLGDYQRSAMKKQPLVERQPDDFDLAWSTHKVYVIDSHEWFDPHTSTHYSDGVSRHAMIGPSVITVSGGDRTTEYHVNDPRVWAWVRRSIAEGHLSPETIQGDVNERSITIKECEKPKRKAKAT